MSWETDVEELERQRAMAREMGGPDSVAFHHGRGKLTVRERVDLLQDEGTFQEIGAIAGTATWDGDEVTALKPSNTVIGTCRVGGDEYLGLLASPCHRNGELACLSCHSMHSSDPNDQLAESRDGNEA